MAPCLLSVGHENLMSHTPGLATVIASCDGAWPGCCRVIAEGQIAEQGTHESLAEAGGLYSGLVCTVCSRHLLVASHSTQCTQSFTRVKASIHLVLMPLLQRSDIRCCCCAACARLTLRRWLQVRRQFNKTASSASLAASARGSYVNLPSLNTLAPLAGASHPSISEKDPP